MPTGPPALAISPAVMPMLALAGADDAGAVRAEQPHAREVALELVEEPGLVLGGHALGDAHDELDAALGRLHHRGAHAGGGDEDARRGGAGLLHRLGDRWRRSGCRRRRCRPSSGWCRPRPGCRSRGCAGRRSGPGCRSGPGRRPWCSRRRRCSLAVAFPASSTAVRAASSMVGCDLQLVGQVGLEDRPALVGVGAVEADDDRARRWRPGRAPRRCRWPPLRRG